MLDFQVAYDKLAQFETADEIADFLFDGGYKGLTCHESRCPIATFLTQETGESVEVVPVMISRGTSATITTKAMMEFIHNFDDEMYPQLILKIT